MTGKSSINVDLDDPRIGKIADVISNSTAKKILGELAEAGDSGLSESELSERLKSPANTINYNIKKLEEAGLVEKISGFLWSVKGKRMYRYRVSNRKIVISPRTGMRGVIPSVLISGLIALGIKVFAIDRSVISYGAETESLRGADYAVSEGASVASDSANMVVEKVVGGASDVGVEVMRTAGNTGDIAAWFFLGALAGLLIFVLWSWHVNSKNGNVKGGFK